MKNNILIVVDMQNDFISGSLGSKEAMDIVSNVVNKINSFEGKICVTLDTHDNNYFNTLEGKNLPVEHCIKNTSGHDLVDSVSIALSNKKDVMFFNKPTFGSVNLAEYLNEQNKISPIDEIELIGVCTDICVVSNALLIKAFLPNTNITVDTSCIAGTSPINQSAAIKTMQSCQINIK